MKRKRFKKADLILWGDVHLMEKNPVARLDDFHEETQWEKVKFVKDLQKQHDCDVLCSGDLFDKWKPSPELISKALEFLPKQLHTIYGQHDLPAHNLELAPKCGIYTLMKAGAVRVLPQASWGQVPDVNAHPAFSYDIKGGKDTYYHRYILVWHKFVWQEKEVFADKATNAKRIIKKYPQYDLILTGDNHKPFVEKYNGRILVNPGSLFRSTAAQIKHRPRVYLYYADTNTIKPVYIPIKDGVLSREHLVDKEERKDRISSFVIGLDTDFGTSVSFDKNLTKFYAKNKLNNRVKEIINICKDENDN